MTWIKICGITNLEDALTAVQAGADALGFVFYEKSPRTSDPDAVARIVDKLPANVEKIGVFVAGENARAEQTISRAGISEIQLQVDVTRPVLEGSTFLEFQYLAVPVTMFLDSTGDFDSIMVSVNRGNHGLRAIFLDSGSATQPGGTGHTFNWQSTGAALVADGIKSAGWKLVIAGGLKPENVGEAIRIFHPWGVDVSSGVESKPGKKDPEKIRAFVNAVREADKANSKN